ncbi:MAG: methylated-DNA--[protein]-cysteine S-methyltransferase [Acidiferrobacteraceae bacterium]|nr:methylated-DNA--[protein]-cysteine S-methyltransferase [Acidiferrobacteraceae bacterium]
MSDYQRAARALTYLEKHFEDQPSLAQTAAAVGLSPYHFQRLFRRWVGISPKRFLQNLTLNSAQRELRKGRSLLDTALEVGLSGPGRLHDLFVTLQGMTPGQYQNHGRQMDISYGVHPTPFGICLIGVAERGICWLSFGESKNDADTTQMEQTWGESTFRRSQALTGGYVKKIFPGAGALPNDPLPVLVQGSEFQLRVWRALLGIPLGATASYGDLAKTVKAPYASRAVGTAVGRNPVSFLIPCHRVIRANGETGQYRWGSPRKQAMLRWEKLHLLATSEELTS